MTSRLPSSAACPTKPRTQNCPQRAAQSVFPAFFLFFWRVGTGHRCLAGGNGSLTLPPFLGEIFELKAELNSDKKEKKKEAVKKVIASMTVGKDVRCAGAGRLRLGAPEEGGCRAWARFRSPLLGIPRNPCLPSCRSLHKPPFQTEGFVCRGVTCSDADGVRQSWSK